MPTTRQMHVRLFNSCWMILLLRLLQVARAPVINVMNVKNGMLCFLFQIYVRALSRVGPTSGALTKISSFLWFILCTIQVYAKSRRTVSVTTTTLLYSRFHHNSRWHVRRKHKKTVHLRERDYRCDECGLAFGERGNLNKHIRSVHRKERNFACSECPAAFSFRNGLTEHTRMKHSDDRPFACPICKSAFKKKSHLVRHRELIHNIGGASSSR